MYLHNKYKYINGIILYFYVHPTKESTTFGRKYKIRNRTKVKRTKLKGKVIVLMGQEPTN